MNEIDLTVLRDLQSDAGAQFVSELIDTFFEEAPTLLAELRAAHAAGDANRFRRAAHSIKSNSLTFGVTALAELARALELGGLPAQGECQALDALDAAYAKAARALADARDG